MLPLGMLLAGHAIPPAFGLLLLLARPCPGTEGGTTTAGAARGNQVAVICFNKPGEDQGNEVAGAGD